MWTRSIVVSHRSAMTIFGVKIPKKNIIILQTWLIWLGGAPAPPHNNKIIIRAGNCSWTLKRMLVMAMHCHICHFRIFCTVHVRLNTYSDTNWYWTANAILIVTFGWMRHFLIVRTVAFRVNFPFHFFQVQRKLRVNISMGVIATMN